PMELHNYFHPGDTAYTELIHVSRSGMTRDIAVYTKDGYNVSHLLVSELGFSPSRYGDGVRVTGTGMDMGFHVVYSMAAMMYPDGFHCAGKRKRCPSDDHSNQPYRAYQSRWKHRSDGYAIRHRWR
ncbi:hypothetical protein, partial [Leclercia adecarboxylata]|uniref:hypothetical protein n=1 Tax=Leclercia adecarboxylata TaxID=83655 RepID=UPI00234DE1A5